MPFFSLKMQKLSPNPVVEYCSIPCRIDIINLLPGIHENYMRITLELHISSLFTYPVYLNHEHVIFNTA